jgi:diadenosine tetraphosphate (Ap4A) HIT family hydrolase
MTTFELHPTLRRDGLPVGDLPLSRVLLLDDRRFPWLVLVPRRPGIREVLELSDPDRGQLWDEVCGAAERLQATCGGDKLNLGALGNQVPQLHFHVVSRFRADAAWPGPVWGCPGREPYAAAAARERIGRLRDAFGAVMMPLDE